MEKFTKELINLDGLNLSKPCEGTLPKHAIVSQSGRDTTTPAERELLDALGDDEYGHIEFVGTQEVLGRMIEIEGEAHVAVMRGDQLYVNAKPIFGLIGTAQLAERWVNVVSNYIDRHEIMDVLRSIDCDSAREELAEYENGKFGVHPTARGEESAQVVWDAWAKGETTFFCTCELNPDKVRARHIKETVPAPQELH